MTMMCLRHDTGQAHLIALQQSKSTIKLRRPLGARVREKVDNDVEKAKKKQP